MKPLLLSLLCALSLFAHQAQAAEPALPQGLGGAPDEPALPTGLGTNQAASTDKEMTSDWKASLPFDLAGFGEARLGVRLQDDPTQKQFSIGEERLHLEVVKSWQSATANLAIDFLYDPVFDHHDIDLETGEGWFDLREANLVLRPTRFSDVKIGRQTLTWGVGDLIFINDLFPKDWNSFFIGRDEEYLKAPSDALKVALYHKIANLDIVYTPRFDSDRFIDGRRISYFNSNGNAVVGRDMPVLVDERDTWFKEGELALRLHRLLGPYETALYYYHGYWKSPNGQDAVSGRFTFPALSVYGASLRGPLLGGIAAVELGYYDSRDDNRGDDPLIRNSEWRVLAGYERELLPELTGAAQYYLEYMVDHSTYRVSLPTGAFVKDEARHVITLRLTKLLMNQNLTLSIFNFYSPSDEDGYLRPKATYKLDDHWTLETGGNIFYGRRQATFFGQFEDNSNVYIAIRYGF